MQGGRSREAKLTVNRLQRSEPSRCRGETPSAFYHFYDSTHIFDPKTRVAVFSLGRSVRVRSRCRPLLAESTGARSIKIPKPYDFFGYDRGDRRVPESHLSPEKVEG